MKKSLFTLAVLGGCAKTASAQTNSTVYGVVDAGVVSKRGSAADSPVLLSSGIQSGSRLDFKGSEDLSGGGLSAKSRWEQSFVIGAGASSQGALFGWQA